MPRQAGAMAEQIGQIHAFGGESILKFKGGQPFPDWRMPVELLVIDHDPGAGGGKSLGA